MSKAESKLRGQFKAYDKEFVYSTEKELVILNEKELKNTKIHYEDIGMIYAGNSDVLQEKISKMEHKLEMERKENEHWEEKCNYLREKHVLELDNARKDVDSLRKELRIKELENQLLQRS